jgi:hypothetical protein
MKTRVALDFIRPLPHHAKLRKSNWLLWKRQAGQIVTPTGAVIMRSRPFPELAHHGQWAAPKSQQRMRAKPEQDWAAAIGQSVVLALSV